METEFSIIKNTEMQENGDYQQCRSDEIIEVADSPSPIHIEQVNVTESDILQEESVSTDSDVVYVSSVQEEPIDLTFDRSHLDSEKAKVSNPRRIIIHPKPPQGGVLKAEAGVFSRSGRGVKRNVDILNRQEIISSNWAQIPHNYTNPDAHPTQKSSNYTYAIVRTPQPDLSSQLTARQQEVLKMAKSIFSKRTRTLYHWMYPTASKQQIKQMVSSMWESMAVQEKNIYIAQVLGRFGCNHADLMVNPQLGQIKELPPMPGTQEFTPKVSELQNAISSISNETDNVGPCFSAVPPRKKPRVTKKKLVQKAPPSVSQEFDDDPELSQELAQFSMMLKNQF